MYDGPSSEACRDQDVIVCDSAPTCYPAMIYVAHAHAGLFMHFHVRLYQVYYSSNILPHMRTLCCMTLGTWHAYKVANERLYVRYLNTVWAPALHTLSPKTIIRDKPNLTQILTLFTQARLAYPTFKARLATAIEHPTISDEERTHLQNLEDLFQFFIPAVTGLHMYDLSNYSGDHASCRAARDANAPE
jgi:hypothetical protein